MIVVDTAEIKTWKKYYYLKFVSFYKLEGEKYLQAISVRDVSTNSSEIILKVNDSPFINIYERGHYCY